MMHEHNTGVTDACDRDDRVAVEAHRFDHRGARAIQAAPVDLGTLTPLQLRQREMGIRL